MLGKNIKKNETQFFKRKTKRVTEHDYREQQGFSPTRERECIDNFYGSKIQRATVMSDCCMMWLDDDENTGKKLMMTKYVRQTIMGTE